MPTYQETVALIEKLEFERCNRGSLLFERFKDIKYSASSNVGSVSKLFDGVPDNWAWEQAKGDDKFYEIDISKIRPTFNKVVIGGYNLDEMEIKVKIGDAYIVPECTEIQNEEFSKTFLLKEAVTADALRMEFHKPDRVLVELYEIEVFKV